MKEVTQRLFALEARGTTVAREVRGGLATFLTMAYILVANPAILATAGVPYEPAVAATAAAAALCTLLMGLGARFPLALAPGMGLNAIVAFQVAPAAGSWQTAMGLVVLDGLVVLTLVALGLREAVMHAIPRDLRRAIGVGIGLFIALIGAVNARLVVAEAAHLQDAEGRVPRLRRILAIDGVSAAVGGLFGASSVTSYVESAAGAAEGARTGLHSVVVAGCFALAVFAAPVAAIVPAAATAPALIMVGFLMTQQITRIDFGALETAIPAFVLLVTIPFTWSISHGIGYGFVTYVVIQVLAGRWRAVHPVMYGTTAAFAAYFWLG